jgi:AraC-like DNA-binding protein
MEKASQMLLKGKSVTEVSDALGFEYPQHFSRMFKKEFGTAPSRVNEP